MMIGIDFGATVPTAPERAGEAGTSAATDAPAEAERPKCVSQQPTIRRPSMSRVTLLDPPAATGDTRAHLDQIKAAFGVVPNMFKAVANSPAALASMWGSFGALGSGTLGARLGEEIAVAVANANKCEYCLAAHTALGRRAGASAEAMAAAQLGMSADPRSQAALTFALKLVHDRGAAIEADVAALKAAGFDDEGVVEIVAHVALNLFTNYVNVALAVPVDFPNVALKRAA